jgi:hypothetical protein
LWLTFRDFLWVVPEGIEFAGDRLHRGECLSRVAFLGDELAADFRRAQTGIQARRTKLGVGLALAIDNSGEIGEQARQVVFRTLAPTGRKGIKAPKTALQFMQAFAEGPTVPTQFAFRLPLAAWSQFFDRSCHEKPASAPLQGLGRVNEQGLERIGQLHPDTSSM